MNPLTISLLLGWTIAVVACSSNPNQKATSNLDPASPPVASINATSPIPEEIKQAAKNLPPISRITWKMCNTTDLTGECTNPPKVTEHWGKVQEIKVVKIPAYSRELVQTHVKSQGCFGYYGEPQSEAWYPVGGQTYEVKGKVASASIVESRLLTDQEKEILLLRQKITGIGLVGATCNPSNS